MQTINYWVKNTLTLRPGGEILHYQEGEEYDKQQALKRLENQTTWEYQPPTRNAHFTALNCLPVVVGTKWVIPEDVYWYFLELLPPMKREKGGFYCCEASTGNIHSAYYQDANGTYWHCYEEV